MSRGIPYVLESYMQFALNHEKKTLGDRKAHSAQWVFKRGSHWEQEAETAFFFGGFVADVVALIPSPHPTPYPLPTSTSYPLP